MAKMNFKDALNKSLQATKKYVDDAIQENGFSGDYNDLENRPCYDDKKAGPIVMTFDGNIEGKDVVDLTDTLGCHFVRVGPGFEPPVADMENFENTEFVKMTTMNIYEGANEENIDEEAYFVVDEAYMPGTYFISGPYGAVFVFTTRQGNGSIVPEGTWLAYSPDNFYISRIECNGMIGEFKELDPKFVPYKPGEKVDGQKFIIDDVEYTANASAEIFNVNNIAVGKYSHAEGHQTIAMEESAHSEGQLTRASGRAAHAEGYKTTASGNDSHAEGLSTIASGQSSHAEGSGTKATGENAHAEGSNTEAIGTFSHAEGHRSKAIGYTTHAEGWETEAAGNYSHVEGYKTKASSNYQHVQGKHNIEDTENKYAHIVGNGASSSKRSNAHTLDWDGNAWYQGQVQGTNLPHDTRVFGEIEITFDGDIEGKETVLVKDPLVPVSLSDVDSKSAVTSNMRYIKASDKAISYEEFCSVISLTAASISDEGEFTESNFPTEELKDALIKINDNVFVFGDDFENGNLPFVIITHENITVDSVLEHTTNNLILTPGIWFLYYSETAYISKFKYQAIISGELKKLDEKYLPDSIANGINVITEDDLNSIFDTIDDDMMES